MSSLTKYQQIQQHMRGCVSGESLVGPVSRVWPLYFDLQSYTVKLALKKKKKDSYGLITS